MKNEKMLEKLHEVVQMLPKEQRELATTMLQKPMMFGDTMPGLCATITDFIKELHEDIKRESAKSSGKSRMKKAADKILMQCADRPNFGAFMFEDLQIVGGKYSAVRLVEPLPLRRDFPENADRPPYNDYIINASKNEGERIQLPERAELSAFIKTDKAAHKGEKKYKPCYDFGENKPKVDAAFLLEMLDILGDDVTVTISLHFPMQRALYFKSDRGDGILMPCHK